MDLIIASSNTNKIRRLKKLISIIKPEIKLKDLENQIIKTPPENSNQQEKNLMMKLKYYHRILGKNVICEDDAVKFETKEGLVSVVKVNSFFLKTDNIYQQWKKYFRVNQINQGKLIKFFGVIIDGKIGITKVMIPLIIKSEGIINNKIEKNVLNNFIGPQSEGMTFTEMSQTEKDDYFKRICLPILGQII
ncbi:MAG: non-canonical purine NTP pyrophosphatase [Candidatus Shapirobacteria bacterium]